MIEIRGLEKTFRTAQGSVTALKDVSLSIGAGEIFGIIGLSGAGKSTLVRCINFLEKPTSGTVTVDGQELGTLTPRQLLAARQKIGMIFQGFNLLSQRSALQNVCFPMELAGVKKADAVKRARELLQLVGLDDREKSYPHQLSGGQKQRVAIARALAMNPKVLLCDEATSALDPNTTQQILTLLKEINQQMGVTVVIITHEMRVIEKICGRVAVIDHSTIVEMGAVKEVFLAPKSEIARQLVLPRSDAAAKANGSTALRLTFDGTQTLEPVVANMILECRCPVNILFANTRQVEGKMLGQMLLQLPDDETSVARCKNYLTAKQIPFGEEDVHVYAENA